MEAMLGLARKGIGEIVELQRAAINASLTPASAADLSSLLGHFAK
jgi:hypothetical protein